MSTEICAGYDGGMSTAPTKPLKRVRWTVKDYFRISETGVFDDRRVELINGDIVEMPAQAHPHRTSLSKTSSVLFPAFDRGRHWVVVLGTLCCRRTALPIQTSTCSTFPPARRIRTSHARSS
jgi:hypothetical protein